MKVKKNMKRSSLLILWLRFQIGSYSAEQKFVNQIFYRDKHNLVVNI